MLWNSIQQNIFIKDKRRKHLCIPKLFLITCIRSPHNHTTHHLSNIFHSFIYNQISKFSFGYQATFSRFFFSAFLFKNKKKKYVILYAHSSTGHEMKNERKILFIYIISMICGPQMEKRTVLKYSINQWIYSYQNVHDVTITSNSYEKILWYKWYKS